MHDFKVQYTRTLAPNVLSKLTDQLENMLSKTTDQLE